MNIDDARRLYLDTADELAPGLVEGLYVVGSFALADWHEGRSDIDIVAVTAEPATDEDASALASLHRQLAEIMPGTKNRTETVAHADPYAADQRRAIAE